MLTCASRLSRTAPPPSRMFARPSAPLTPRSPAVGTPRSARRLTTTATTPSRPSTFAAAFPLAPLPPLSLRPYPPSAYAADEDFAALRADDRDNIDRAVDRMRQAGSDRLRDLAGTMAEIDEGKRSVEEECRNLRDAAMDMTHQLKIERDQAEEAKEKEAEVAQRARKLKGDVDAIRADILEVEAKLAARRTRACLPSYTRTLSWLTDAPALVPSQAQAAGSVPATDKSKRTRTRLLRGEARAQDPRASASVPSCHVLLIRRMLTQATRFSFCRRRGAVQIHQHRPREL